MPLDGFSVSDRSVCNLFCGYADLTGENPSAVRVTKEQLVRAGFDYAALGSVHNAGGLRRAVLSDTEVTYFAYSGCLCGRSFEEPGFKYAVRGALSKETGKAPVLTVRRLRFDRCRYETLTTDLTGCRTESDVRGRLSEAAEALSCDADTHLRITLTGEAPVSLRLDETTLRTYLPPAASLSVCDRTSPAGGTELLSADPTLRGAFCAELLPLIGSGSEEEKETARLALRLGLAALDTDGRR